MAWWTPALFRNRNGEIVMNTYTGTSATPLLSAIGRSWWVLLLFGIVAIVFGALAVSRPVVAAIALAWTAGIMALVEGLISLVALFGKDTGISKGWLALYAIASLLFGGMAIMNPASMAGALVLVLAAWLIVAGIFRIVFAIRVRKVIEGEWWLILSGALGILLGVMFAMNPLAGMVTTSLWIGICALVYGGFQIFAAFKLRKFAAP